MIKLFNMIIFVGLFVPLSTSASVGDKYTCISSQYVEVTKEKGAKNFRSVKFEFLWVSPEDSAEQIIWIPSHPELMMSETGYLIEEQPELTATGGTFIRFNLHPNSNSNITNTGGLFYEGQSESSLYLTMSSSGLQSITSVIASCKKNLM